MSHHLIFEGAELAGKSWLMSQVYNYLEPKYNQSGNILDGCHWFNSDVGVFGTEDGKQVIELYVDIFKKLQSKNILAEKLHISDKIYNRLYSDKEIDYEKIEEKLAENDFKIVLITFKKDLNLIKKRIQDRVNLYPHYERILHKPEWYLKQQEIYLKEVLKSKLESIIIETDQFPDEVAVNKILKFINEK